VDNLKGKILLASVIATLIFLAVSPAANAAVSITPYGYTDKTSYNPGDTVTLKLFIYEGGTDTFNLINVTVVYPWYNVIWGGNQTIDAANAPIAQGENWPTTVTFTIPTDGRARTGTIGIDYYYRVGSTVTHIGPIGLLTLYINSVPIYASLQDLDQLTMLLTIHTVLLIVGFLIVTGAIFLSTRRPKTAWKAEERE
jgi:hypothetical protein